MQRTLQGFLARPLLDNTVGDFLWPLLIILLAIVFGRTLSKVMARSGYRLIRHWTPAVQREDFIKLLLKPLAVFMEYLIFIAAIDHLQYPGVLNFQIHFLHTQMASLLQGLKLIVLTVLFFRVILRLTDFAGLVFSHKINRLHHPSGDKIVFFFRDFVKAVIGIIGFIVVIRYIAGKALTSKLVGALGIGAAALALAAKETIQNLMGSFIILLDKPFRIGDYIKMSSVSGTVEKVGLRSTRIRSDDRTFVTVPNSQIIDNILEDVTLMTYRKTQISLQLDPAVASDSLEKVQKEIEQVLQSEKDVMDNFMLHVSDISNHSYTIQILFYTRIREDHAYTALKQRVNLEIIKAIENSHTDAAKGFNIKISS